MHTQEVHRFGVILARRRYKTCFHRARESTEIKPAVPLPMCNLKAFGYSGLVVGVLCFIVRECFLNLLPRNKIPHHMLNNKIVLEKNLIQPDMGQSLLDLAIKIGSVKGYPTNTNDTSFYHAEHEHIGEAIPIEITSEGNVRCSNPFLIPSSDRTQCVLPGRIDIGRHLMLTGGALGLREKYDTIISRVQSFGAYHFNLNTYPVVSRLFQDATFMTAARNVCPPSKQHLDPFQFNFIIQVPGQTVPMHVDGVYFWGASRFQFPQWLLAAMMFSGLEPWKSDFVDQVQVVGYLHQWKPRADITSFEEDDAGSFLYWTNSSPVPDHVLPRPLSGVVVDGSKTVHAASVYRMADALPSIDKAIPHWLRHVGQDQWTLSNARDGVLQNYSLNDLRVSIVYRARCFRDGDEAQAYRARLHGPGGTDGRYSLDDVLATFVKDLVARGKLAEGTVVSDIPRLRLALLIMDEYIHYPLPASKVVPWNYCMLTRLWPWLGVPLSLVC